MVAPMGVPCNLSETGLVRNGTGSVTQWGTETALWLREGVCGVAILVLFMPARVWRGRLCSRWVGRVGRAEHRLIKGHLTVVVGEGGIWVSGSVMQFVSNILNNDTYEKAP